MKKRKPIFTGLLAILGLGAVFGGVCLATGSCQNPMLQNISTTPIEQSTGGEAVQQELYWHTSVDEAIRESERTGNPIFVDFYATWCPPCKMLEQQTYPDPHFTKEAQSWVLLKIDTDEKPEIAMRYGVSGLPTLAALNTDGQPIAGVSGFHNARDLVKFMHAAKERRDQISE